MSCTMTKAEGRERAKLVGYRYGGFADGFHLFHQEQPDGTFRNVRATEADMQNGDFEYLIVKGLTR